MTILRTTEWEGEHTRLVRLDGLPTGPGRYREIRGREIETVFVHQSAGNMLRGQKAAERISWFHTAPPKYKLNPDGSIRTRMVRGKPRKWWIGGGRGWPGAGYTFVIPAFPDTVEGKLEVYRLHPDETVSYHTGGRNNRRGVAVCVAGLYRTRHGKSRGQEAPDPTAQMALQELVFDYLLPRYGLTPGPGDPDALCGHFDAGKAACPGDWMEQWVRFMRGEDVPDPRTDGVLVDPRDRDDEIDRRPLDTHAQRQAALVELGFDLGPWGPNGDGVDGSWGEDSKGALLAFQDTAEIKVDGRWGGQTEAAVRIALAQNAAGKWPPGS